MAVRLPVPQEIDGLVGVCFRIWKQRFSHVWERLQEASLLDDWRQEAVLIASCAYREGLRYGDRRLPGFIYNAWYAFLRKYGFCRPRGASTFVRDVPVPADENFVGHVRKLLEEDEGLRQLRKAEKAFENEWACKYTYQGKTFYFKAHFFRRWKERIPLEFSPQAVIQQYRLGKVLFAVKSGNKTIARVACPWFTLVVDVTDKTFITVWRGGVK